MKRIKENARDQGILFSDHFVGDRLTADNEVFLFEKLFEKLDISSITNSYSVEGGSMFCPKDQLAVLLFAFHKGVTSSVKIAELLTYNLQFIYLAGGHLIKRRTLSDFRLKHIDSIKEIFVSSVNLAIESELVSSKDIYAIDGSKIEANASSSKTRKKIEWEKRQSKIIEHVEKFLKEWEKQDELEENSEEEKQKRFKEISERLSNIKIQRNEDSNSNQEDESDNETNNDNQDKSENLTKDQKTKNALAKKAAGLKNYIKIKNSEDAEKYLVEFDKIVELVDEYENSSDDMLLSLTDSDCRIMKSDKTTKECYNAQIISNNQVIVAMDITQSENDQSQLQPLTEQLKENINISEKIKFAGDAGYNKGENLEYLDKEEYIDPYISMFDRSKKENPKIEKEYFQYDEDDDSWVCPQGKKLEFMKEYIQNGKKYTQYGCELKNCIECKERNSCVTTKTDIKRGFRTIDDDSYVIYRKEMIEKMHEKIPKEIYSKRSGEVEPVFGQIKNNKIFRRFKLQGLKKVKAEFTIMAIAHNLGKIMKDMRRKELKLANI